MATRTHVPDRRVSEGEGSTTGGVYGVSPESPGGDRICYAVYPELVSLGRDRSYTAELWVCDRNGTAHRKLTTVPNAGTHNGLQQRWVSDDRIALLNEEGGGGTLVVVDAETGATTLGPERWGVISHDAHDGCVLYSNIKPGIPDGAVERQRGIYELDCETGDRRLLVSRDDLRARLVQGGRQLAAATPDVNHMQYAPGGDRVSFLADTKHVGVVDRDGTGLELFPGKKPMHYQWFDDDSLFGQADVSSNTAGPSNAFLNDSAEDFKCYRWDLDERRQVEMIAGYGCHPAISPDREFVASEPWYRNAPITARLYRRGEDLPERDLFTTDHTEVVWTARLHWNPAFSRDGDRLYYTKPVDEATVHLCYVDLSEIGVR